MAERFAERLEQRLTRLHEGLSRPRTVKALAKVHERIGRLKAAHRRVAGHHDIEVIPDDNGVNAVAVRWNKRPTDGSMLTHPGVYCLRSNVTDWDEATLWRTYTTLTDVEAVFRTLKSELGLRPVHHRKQVRAEGHLFITVIAYQAVQVVRKRLAAAGERASCDHPAQHPRRTTARHRHLQASRRAHPACPHRHRRRDRPARHPRRPRHRPPLRRHAENHRLTSPQTASIATTRHRVVP